VDHQRIIMSLKSGLLVESSWALDMLNILLRDNRTSSSCQLDRMPGLLDCLVDHWTDTKKWLQMIEKSRVEGSNDDVGYIVQPVLGRVEVEYLDWECFNTTGEAWDKLVSKVSVVTTVLRNLSSIIGNEEVMGRHTALLSQCGEVMVSSEVANYEEVENVFVCLSNISLYTDLSPQPGKVILNILTSLIRWSLTYSTITTTTFHRMSLELLCKLCLHQSNIDLLLATPPSERLEQLCHVLVDKLYLTQDQMMREVAVSLLYIMSTSTSFCTTLPFYTRSISLLISFIEQAEEAAQEVVRNEGVAVLKENPSRMGTSLIIVRRAANILSTMAQSSITSSLFIKEEQRLVHLAMSPVLDQEVAKRISEVMFFSSNEFGSNQRVTRWGW